jgi:hypothetical protein
MNSHCNASKMAPLFQRVKGHAGCKSQESRFVVGLVEQVDGSSMFRREKQSRIAQWASNRPKKCPSVSHWVISVDSCTSNSAFFAILIISAPKGQ